MGDDYKNKIAVQGSRFKAQGKKLKNQIPNIGKWERYEWCC